MEEVQCCNKQPSQNHNPHFDQLSSISQRTPFFDLHDNSAGQADGAWREQLPSKHIFLPFLKGLWHLTRVTESSQGITRLLGTYAVFELTLISRDPKHHRGLVTADSQAMETLRPLPEQAQWVSKPTSLALEWRSEAERMSALGNPSWFFDSSSKPTSPPNSALPKMKYPSLCSYSTIFTLSKYTIFYNFHAFPIWEKSVVFLLTSPAPWLVA